MAFRNFLKSNRWKSFANSFGRHSNRVAQQDFNATIVDYIFELESQLSELNDKLAEATGERVVRRQNNQAAFSAYQSGKTPVRRPKPHSVWDEERTDVTNLAVGDTAKHGDD